MTEIAGLKNPETNESVFVLPLKPLGLIFGGDKIYNGVNKLGRGLVYPLKKTQGGLSYVTSSGTVTAIGNAYGSVWTGINKVLAHF